MRSHIMRVIEGPNSGYAEVRIYPENIHKSTRARKCHKSIRSLVNANRRHAFETCYLEAIENFTPDDYCLTITFPENTPDSERLKHLKNLIKRLQRLYKAFGKVLRYMYFTGRGKDTNMLHFHMLVNYEDEIPWDTIRRKAYKKDKVNAYLSKIRRYRDCGDNMKLCITYLFHHRDSLTAADCEIYKKYWYPSHDLRGFDDCVNTTDGTMHLRKLYNAYIHGSLESYITKAFPGYNLQKYGYYNRDGGSPFYYDLYDRLYCKLIFARKGSILDTGHYIYHTHGLAIDSITGEVLSDNQSLMGSHDVH